MCEPEEMTEGLDKLEGEPADAADDAAAVVGFGEALAGLVLDVFPRWVAHTVSEHFGTDLTNGAEDAGGRARDSLRGPLMNFFSLDIDEQRTTPLSIIRAHMVVVTEYLTAQGIRPVERDEFDTRSHPADLFGLGPFAWIDFGEDVHVAGLQWGAAKAFVHRQRHLPIQPTPPAT